MKWGAGHADGMFRKGFKETGPVFQALPDSIRSPEEPGVAGNLTPQEIQQGKEQSKSYDEWLSDRANGSSKESSDRGMDM